MARKQYNVHFIYKTTCLITGKYYIGMHSTFNEDDSYIGSGKHLCHSIRKHGKENHVREIVEYCVDRSSLKVREKEIVNEELLNDPMCMNLKIGGEGGFPENTKFGIIPKEEQRRRSREGGLAFSEKRKENIEIDKGYREKLSETTRNSWKDEEYRKSVIKGISGEKNGFYGKQHSEDTKEKMRGKSHQKGEGNSQYGSCWITNGLKNKKIKKSESIPFGWTLGRK
jgi:hypothetical protein